MSIVSIEVSNELNPTELSDWFANNPSAVVNFMLNDGRIFFIFYS